jgi:hypothetical protein
VQDDFDYEQELADTHRKLVTGNVSGGLIAANTPPDKATIWAVVQWLMAESSLMPPEMAEQFDHLLSGYRTKLRIMTYAIMKERFERMATAVEAEDALMNELLAAKPFMSNADKIKLLDILSKIIAEGTDALDRMAGVSDNPDDVVNEVRGKLKDDGPFSQFTVEEREKIRQVVNKVLKLREAMAEVAEVGAK